MKYLMLIVSSLLLSACAAPYATPTEGDIANLKVPIPGTKFIHGWPPTGWSGTHINIGELDEGGCIDGLLSSVDSDVIAEDGTIVVPANKDLFIQISVSRGDVACIIGTIIQFEKDKSYELQYQLYSDHCAITIPQRTIAGELVPTRLYEYETSGWSTGCKVEGDIDKKLVFCVSGLAPLGDRGCFE
jgi:hypothetical protein